MTKGIIISVINNKGGCGKTTTACNLADALGKKGKSVLVVDIDSQCNATTKLLPDSTNIRKSLFELLDPSEKNISMDEVIYPTEIKNVSVLANIGLTGNIEPDLIMNAPESFFRLREILRPYAIDNFDFTIIDNPPNMGSFVLCSLYASDCVIVPIKSGSADSVEGLSKAMQLVSSVQEKGNADLRFLRILINCFDKRTAVSRAVADQVSKMFGASKVFENVIPINTAFEKSELLKDTIFGIDSSSTGAKAFRKLAAELIAILENK